MINIERVDELNDLNIQIYKDLTNIITTAMQELKEVVIPDNIYDYDISYSICYDGGNHPEYDSDCFAMVEKIELKEDNIIIHTEYGTEYLECLSNQDLFTIAYLIDFVTNRYETYENERE